MGEIRDAESLDASINAAASGRALMASLHARNAVNTVSMMRKFGLDSREIATHLDLVVAQRLVRRLCMECAEKGSPTDDEKQLLKAWGETDLKSVWHARGCDACNDIGFVGREGIFETWLVDNEAAELIASGAGELEINALLEKQNHSFLRDEALAKVREGITTLDEVKRISGREVVARRAKRVEGGGVKSTA